MSETIKIKLIRSGIGCPERHRKTLKALGLNRLGAEAVIDRNNAVLGMIEKVKHLVCVVE